MSYSVDDFVEIPSKVHPLLSPIVYVVPLQLFAYHMSIERRLDPDRPRNLAKSVTVTWESDTWQRRDCERRFWLRPGQSLWVR